MTYKKHAKQLVSIIENERRMKKTYYGPHFASRMTQKMPSLFVANWPLMPQLTRASFEFIFSVFSGETEVS
jgi:hypothetical protein